MCVVCVLVMLRRANCATVRLQVCTTASLTRRYRFSAEPLCCPNGSALKRCTHNTATSPFPMRMLSLLFIATELCNRSDTALQHCSLCNRAYLVTPGPRTRCHLPPPNPLARCCGRRVSALPHRPLAEEQLATNTTTKVRARGTVPPCMQRAH